MRNILSVVQQGRLGHEALLLAASLRAQGHDGRLILAEPQPQGAWAGHDTLLPDGLRGALRDLGAEILPFVAWHFGAAYPYGNKIEALRLLPAGEPFLFLDTDTVICGDLGALDDRAAPCASMLRSGTWPEPPAYGPGLAEIWGSLYDRFGIDFAASQDTRFAADDWRRYLYFNAGWFLGPDPAPFALRFRVWALAVRADPGDALACQSLDPWLDQIVLPLVIASLGGGRPDPASAALDGALAWHWRTLPLAYARGSEAQLEVLEKAAADKEVRRHLREWEPAREMIYRGRGRRQVRPLADSLGPVSERILRQKLRSAGLWRV